MVSWTAWLFGQPALGSKRLTDYAAYEIGGGADVILGTVPNPATDEIADLSQLEV